MQIQDSVAIIVGGASGMARATAELVASEGAKVAIFDLESSAGDEVAASLPGDAIFRAVDIMDYEGVGTAIEGVARHFGAVHIGVNLAGGQVGGPSRTLSKKGPHDLENFRRTLELNTVGSFNFLRLAAEQMAKNEPNADGERGCVINTASIAAYEGQIGQVSYSAAKSAIVGMTFVAARDLGNIGVRVNAIAPSLFNTGLVQKAPQEMKDALVAGAAFPLRMGEPREYALLAKAIIENPMLNGGTIRLDAGQRFGPR
jgi:NAD(P)-dependent dehydrogenase (short-subunit alcohol dehydrogenase family)